MRSAHIAVFEKNLAVRRRIERVLRAAAELKPARGFASLDDGELELASRPQLVGCNQEGAQTLEAMLTAAPFASVVLWGTRDSRSRLRLGAEDPRFGHFIAWPEFSSMPRPSELGYTARRLLRAGGELAVTDLLGYGCCQRVFHPTSTTELDEVVAETRALSDEAGAASRQVSLVAGVAHELLMNAMYTAPRSSDGRQKYAHDRKQFIRLEPDEVPSLRWATDGQRLGIQVSDRFGGLDREHLYGGILRGLDSAHLGEAVDVRGGGAGLGLYQIYASASSVFVEVQRTRRTDIVAMFDLDVSLRDQRSVPTTLCFFEV